MTLPTVLLFGWAGVAAWMDLRRRHVRWWWSLLGLLGAAGYRLVTWVSGGVVLNQAVIIFVAVTASYSLWKADWWGGADAKTAMTLVIAIPDLTFVAIVALVSLLGSGLRLVARRGEGSLVQVVVDAIQVVRKDVRDGERLPLVAVMAGALPIYLFYELVVP